MSPDLTFSTGLDILIAVLLIATIAYAVSLSRKLTRLRDDKGEMEALIARLIEATDRAQAGLEGLRRHAGELGEQLSQGIERSRGPADELAFLIDRAEALSSRLDGKITAARLIETAAPALQAGGQASATAPRTAKSPIKAGPAEAPTAESSLLKTLQGMR